MERELFLTNCAALPQDYKNKALGLKSTFNAHLDSLMPIHYNAICNRVSAVLQSLLVHA